MRLSVKQLKDLPGLLGITRSKGRSREELASETGPGKEKVCSQVTEVA